MMGIATILYRVYPTWTVKLGGVLDVNEDGGDERMLAAVERRGHVRQDLSRPVDHK